MALWLPGDTATAGIGAGTLCAIWGADAGGSWLRVGRVDARQVGHPHQPELTGEGNRLIATLLLRETADLVFARIVDRHLAVHVDGEPARSGEVSISQIVLSAGRSCHAQIGGPPIAGWGVGHEKARAGAPAATLLLIAAAGLALPAAALGLALTLRGHSE